jgi:hypothetical protein
MIRITYQLRAESTPRSMELTPEQYYDPFEPGQTTGRIPRFHHAYQYTEHSADKLRWTVLEGGPIEGAVIRTQFLDGRQSMMTHRADAANILLARARRPASVPWGQPSCSVASLIDLPSTSHSKMGSR